MGLKWEKGMPGSTRSVNCNVHTVKPGTMALVAFLCGGGEIIHHKLHWIKEDDKGKSFPCLGEHCRLCPWPTQTRWYAPVLNYTMPLPSAGSTWTRPEPPYRYQATRWERRVLEITVGWSAIVEQAAVGALFLLERPAGKKQTRTRFEHLGALEGIPAGLAFDVRPYCMRMWGLQDSLWE